MAAAAIAASPGRPSVCAPAAAMSSSSAGVASNAASASNWWTSAPNSVPPDRARSAARVRFDDRDLPGRLFQRELGLRVLVGCLDPLAHRRDLQRGRRPALARIDAREPPAVVAAPAVGDHVPRHVLDDQVLAAHAEVRLLRRASSAPGSHQTTEYRARRERVQAGHNVRGTRRLVVRALQHRVLRLERRALRRRAASARERPAADTARDSSGRSQPPSHGSSPSAGTTSRSRARVAATYASRTPSA